MTRVQSYPVDVFGKAWVSIRLQNGNYHDVGSEVFCSHLAGQKASLHPKMWTSVTSCYTCSPNMTQHYIPGIRASRHLLTGWCNMLAYPLTYYATANVMTAVTCCPGLSTGTGVCVFHSISVYFWCLTATKIHRKRLVTG